MKKYSLTLLLLIMTACGYSQTAPLNFPPHRAAEQTIGEKYTLLPLFAEVYKAYDLVDAKGKNVSKENAGKTLTLIALNKVQHTALLKDSVGAEFTASLLDDYLPELILQTEVQAARSLINKKLWLIKRDITAGLPKNDAAGPRITDLFFEPVQIVNVSLSPLATVPFHLTVKTSTGQIGFVPVTLNDSYKDPEFNFSSIFKTEDPKLKYHFTPAVWKMVKAGYTDIGMPMDAFQLVMGSPNDIHSTKTAKGTTYQWVYGTSSPTYYYFENGKLTAKQN